MEGSEQPYTQEEMKYLAAVRKDSSDFTSWTNLLQLVEQKVIYTVLYKLKNCRGINLVHCKNQPNLIPSILVFHMSLS